MAEKKHSFEQNMGRLEEIVALLERGEVPLEESLKFFEEGTTLMKQCASLLDKAEQKVTILTAGHDGAPTEKTFDEEG